MFGPWLGGLGALGLAGLAGEISGAGSVIAVTVAGAFAGGVALAAVGAVLGALIGFVAALFGWDARDSSTEDESVFPQFY